MKIAKNIIDLIGNTPLVRLDCLSGENDATIFAKLESYNPGGSIKDRIGYAMIVDAEKRGLLKPGHTIVEPTAGNTGIALSLVAIAKGYHLILTMPENVSQEKYTLLSAFGAEIILTPEAGGMGDAIWKAEEIVRRNPCHFMPNQFSNPANPEIHRQTTAPEILQALDCRIDFLLLVSELGVHSRGLGKHSRHIPLTLRSLQSNLVFLPFYRAEPRTRRALTVSVLEWFQKCLNVDIVDRVMTVSDEGAYQMMKRISRSEGLLVGMSSGANVYAALKLAQELGRDKTVVTILPDTGERYFSLAQYFEPEPNLVNLPP